MTCNCEHDTHRAPASQAEALDLARHCTAIAGHLETVAKADDKWMSVMRCNRCGALWAEDSISSGHATLFFIYPIMKRDPVAWLAAAVPLIPRRSSSRSRSIVVIDTRRRVDFARPRRALGSKTRFAAQPSSQPAEILGVLVEAADELSRVASDDERLLHAQQCTTRRATTRSRQFRRVGQRLGSAPLWTSRCRQLS